jgi:hypothetical protein
VEFLFAMISYNLPNALITVRSINSQIAAANELSSACLIEKYLTKFQIAEIFQRKFAQNKTIFYYILLFMFNH